MKLKKFTSYVTTLLPHEVMLLERIKQFQDDDRRIIFYRLKNNILHPDDLLEFDESIDKRKYSHLMNWMQSKLEASCTDQFYKRLNYFDNRIKTDTISSEEEKELLMLIKNYEAHHYHFIKFYEVVKNYLIFLLVRVRLNDYGLINEFIHQYHDDYTRCKEVGNRMIQAASDIVSDYHNSRLTPNSSKWENWLKRLYLDSNLDGYNRYQALILISYIALNKPELLHEALEFFNDLEEQLINGSYYSRKLLLNYYGNKQLILMKLHKYDEALYYGELSISDQGHDYIMYLNNYCFNLLKLGQPKKALHMLKQALPFVRQMSNKYNRTLFISSLTKCYNDNELYKDAKRYAENQLALHEKDILEHNWNNFFRTYIETLLYLREYATIKKCIKRYNLIERENFAIKTHITFPYFKWFLSVVDFKEGNITEQKFMSSIRREMEQISNTHQISPSKKVMSLLEQTITTMV
ncbi:tetratricopeptide repeat protein [Aegicerativicinus sediminis]|uniref:tetratricopeptide repeat protein n=1 Tax=Aegicerativicinus sediminis TaxID=2893202 RepID=UPI001E651AEB|nr:tetratricopeptide repeat protein [Aegicerativicinus sediminis]